MKVDHVFASRVAHLAAEMVADGWPYGTFDNPDWVLAPESEFEGAVMRAAWQVWTGPGWWRKDMSKATRCLRTIRWITIDDPEFKENESLARSRWKSLNTNERVILLLLAAKWLKTVKPKI